MDKKYVLIKPYDCKYGKLAEGTEIIFFRGAFYVNGGLVPASFNDILADLIEDKDYVKVVKIAKNEF